MHLVRSREAQWPAKAHTGEPIRRAGEASANAELTQRFAAIREMIEAHILAQMLAGGDTFYSYRFEIDVATIRGLIHVFQVDERLWVDVHTAVQAHRELTHWTMLPEHVYAVGNLMGKLMLLEQSLSCHARDDRRLIAEHVNGIDGEIGFCEDLADRRDLAKRVNRAIGHPLIDGLSLRGLTYVLGVHAGLLDALRALVEQSRRTVAVSDSNKEPAPPTSD